MKSEFYQENGGSYMDENACENCGQCKCFSCKKREHGIGYDFEASQCGRCENNCGDVPVEDCNEFEYCDC